GRVSTRSDLDYPWPDRTDPSPRPGHAGAGSGTAESGHRVRAAPGGLRPGEPSAGGVSGGRRADTRYADEPGLRGTRRGNSQDLLARAGGRIDQPRNSPDPSVAVVLVQPTGR